jgi:hypothetical protein
MFNSRSGRQESTFRYERPLGGLAIDPSGQILYAAVQGTLQRETEIVELGLPDGELRRTLARRGEQVNQLLVGP